MEVCNKSKTCIHNKRLKFEHGEPCGGSVPHTHCNECGHCPVDSDAECIPIEEEIEVEADKVLTVLPRPKIVEAMKNMRVRYGIIIISDPYPEPIGININLDSNMLVGVLKMMFYDCGPETMNDGRYVFDSRDYETLMFFALQMQKQEVRHVLISCNKGLHRSVAAAYILEDFYKRTSTVKILGLQENPEPNKYMMGFI